MKTETITLIISVERTPDGVKYKQFSHPRHRLTDEELTTVLMGMMEKDSRIARFARQIENFLSTETENEKPDKDETTA